MKRALWACFGALLVWSSFAQPAAAQELMNERQTATGMPLRRQAIAAPQISCAPQAFDSSLSVGERRRLIVTTAYCSILRRSPDAAGLAYWIDLLGDGLGPYEMVQTLVASPERAARGTKSFNESLAALTLSPRKRIEIEQRRLEAEAEAEAARKAEEARKVEERRRAEEQNTEAERQKRESRLRTRVEISTDAFNDRVAAAQLADAEAITGALTYGRLSGDGQRITVAYVHLSQTRGMRVSPGNRGRATVGTWAAEIGAHVAINGNWYSPYDGPAVSNGAVYGGEDHFYTAPFGFTADGDAIIEHHRETNDGVDNRIVEAVAGHPTLVFRGERTTDFGGDPTFTSRNPRTAIGLDDTGDVLILVTVDGRSSTARGMTGDETAKLMERLGAHDAVMLDGGGSSTMWIAGRGVVNRPSGSLRAVGNQVAVYGD